MHNIVRRPRNEREEYIHVSYMYLRAYMYVDIELFEGARTSSG